MPQTVVSAPAPPPTPAPQQPRDFGDAISKAVDDALAGALAPARAGLQAEIAAMRAERQALSAALDATTDRSARRELERQIDRLDQRIEKAEEGLAKIEQRLTTRDGPGTAVVGVPQTPRLPPMEPSFDPAPMVIAVVGILFVGFPIALTIARLLWKRATNAPPPALNAETTRRFDRLEQSVDAIAIEVERISENQRYLTRLLGESKQQQKIGT